MSAGADGPHRALTGFHAELLSRARRSARVRAYVLTGGRTRTQRVLLVETFVSARRGADSGEGLGPESASILAFCHSRRTVAEIATALRLPLGVVRVLIGDLERKGLLQIHPDAATVPRREILERVLRGLSDPQTV
jgi:DNA-binding MarR family transcriptional regulator